MQDIATELGISATGLSLNDSRVRALLGKPSGAISLSDAYGKSSWAATNTLTPRYYSAWPDIPSMTRNTWSFATAGTLGPNQIGELSPRTITTSSGAVVTFTRIEASLNATGAKGVSISYTISPNKATVAFTMSTANHKTDVDGSGSYGTGGFGGAGGALLFDDIQCAANANGTLQIKLTAT